MDKYLVGYPQVNNTYAFVSDINLFGANTSSIIESGIDFLDEETARKVANYLNGLKETDKTYKPLLVSINIKECEF